MGATAKGPILGTATYGRPNGTPYLGSHRRRASGPLRAVSAIGPTLRGRIAEDSLIKWVNIRDHLHGSFLP